MTDRPIIFSAPMINALLDGRKSQTRRLLKPQPEYLGGYGDEADHEEWGWIGEDGTPLSVLDIYPNGYRKGDRLWVREAWRIGAWDFEDSTMCVDFRADGFADKTRRHVADGDWFNTAWQGVSDELRSKGIHPDADGNYRWDVGRGPLRWRPSIHMPRWASRLTLVVTDVRVTRLQDITEADAIREGIERLKSGRGFYDPTVSKAAVRFGEWTSTARQGFQRLWNSIHGPDAWDANPWVAAISFETHRCNIDKMGESHD